MAGSQIFLLKLPRGWPVALAVILRAEIRSALDYRRASVSFIPVFGPFPDVAYHVMKSESIRLEATGGRAANIAIATKVSCRESALIMIGLDVAILVKRRIRLGGTCSRRIFPLLFAG